MEKLKLKRLIRRLEDEFGMVRVTLKQANILQEVIQHLRDELKELES